jgi:hypothetical protein
MAGTKIETLADGAAALEFAKLLDGVNDRARMATGQYNKELAARSQKLKDEAVAFAMRWGAIADTEIQPETPKQEKARGR